MNNTLNCHIEKEYKVMINQKQYEELKQKYQTTTRKQTNYYFDTEPSLKDRNISVRIREINNKYLFTLKHKTVEIQEYEFPIQNFSLENPQIKKITSNFGIQGLKLRGKLVTIRSIYVDEFGELCIDKNFYNNKTDYEVEYELFDSNMDKLPHFKELLSIANIPYLENKISKIARCLKEDIIL